MASKEPFMQRHHFLLRRLHSFTGVVPIGVFLIVHLTTNASIVWGRLGAKPETSHGGVSTFQHEVEFIHSLPGLLLIEIFGLWLPIAFHSILGVYYATTGRSNLRHYSYQDNWRYTLQRISGYIGVVFIFYHVATLRWGWTWLPFASSFSFREASSTTAIALRGGSEEIGVGAVAVGLLYLIGVLMLVFHFANGLWTAAITWGVTITEQAQRRWGFACAGLGFGLAGLALAALVGFISLDIDEAREYERARIIELESAAAPDQPAGQLEHARAPH